MDRGKEREERGGWGGREREREKEKIEIKIYLITQVYSPKHNKTYRIYDRDIMKYIAYPKVTRS